MLDIGSGDKPHWRADVLVDKFISSSHSNQRSLGGEVSAVEPLFESALESLPFRDHAFDYVYCAHVLEHVADPARALDELQRVGKRGYIEVPFSGIQKILDQETHLWLCDLVDGVLTFTAKERFVYDDDIERFLDRGVRGPFAFLMNFYPAAAMIRLHWSESSTIRVQVFGTPNMRLAEPSTDELPLRRGPSLKLWPLFRSVVRRVYASSLRRGPISLNAIVKDEYRREPDEVLTRSLYHF
jgi:SAM-dependent methyltransferase